jgi:hypothetical protein
LGDEIVSELAASVAKLGSLRAANPFSDPSKHHLHQREMNKDRINFAQAIADIGRTWEQDARLNQDPALKADFNSRFTAMRHTLSKHQAAWTAERMAAEPKEYDLAVTATGKALTDFLAWARQAL